MVSKKGDLGRTILDDFENEKSETDYTLGSGNEVYSISFTTELDEEELGDINTASVTGYKLEELIVTDDYEISSDSQVLGASSSIGTKKFVVIPVNFKDDRSKPLTKNNIRRKMFCDPSCTDSVKTYYRKVSGGKLTVTGKVLDYWKVNLYKREMCGDYSRLTTKLKKQKPWLFDGRYYGIMFVHPKVQCDKWAGRGTLGKSGYGPAISWINDFSIRVLSHELGHNFGIHHANLILYPQNKAILLGGKFIEYGDKSDTMGSRLANLNGPHSIALGFRSRKIIKRVSTTGTYRVNKITNSKNPRIIRVENPDNNIDLYIEYRGRKLNYDSGTAYKLGQGVLIYSWSGIKSQKTWNFAYFNNNYDTTLKDGQVVIWQNYRIKQISHTSNYTILKITKL